MPQNNLFADDVVPTVIKAAAVATGVGVVFEVIRHRKLLLTAAACAGGAMLVQHWLKDGLPNAQSRSLRRDIGTPSFPGEAIQPSSQLPTDEIDEAAMESFPASDAPASYRRA